MAHDNNTFTIFDEFAKVVQERPTKPAILYPKIKHFHILTYIELYYQAIKLGNLFYFKGIQPLDRIAIMLPNQPEWPISFMAVQYAGAIAVPLDIKMAFREVKKLLLHSGARILLCAQHNCNDLRTYLGDIKTLEVIPVDAEETLQRLSLSAQETKRATQSPENPAAMFYTSGTTDNPKAVLLSHNNLLSNVHSIMQLGITSDQEVLLALLPLHHTYPFTVTCLLPLLEGARVSYPVGISSDDIINCLCETEVTALVGVPQIFSLFDHGIADKLNKLPTPKKIFLHIMLPVCWWLRKTFGINLAKDLLAELHKRFGENLRFMISGGARLEPKIARDFFRWGFTILEGYGLTETSPIITFNPLTKPKLGSVGLPIPGVMVKISHPDEKGVGEIAVQGPNVMLGYYQLPDESRRAMPEGWFLTGDLGYLDEEGYVYITGRKDEMIVLSSGKKVDPEEIEKHYSMSPFIKEICVFTSEGKAFAEGANQLFAVVFPNEENLRVHGESLHVEEKVKSELDSLSRGLPSYKRIKGFVLADENFPRTSLGKLMRHKVAGRYGVMMIAAKKKDEVLTEDELSLLSDPTCQKLLKYLSERLNREVSLSDHLELDLGLDSLGRMELLLEMQKFLSIEIPEEKTMELFYASTIEEMLLRAQPYFPKT
jgi:long-chain acyl-CoA synthetase